MGSLPQVHINFQMLKSIKENIEKEKATNLSDGDAKSLIRMSTPTKKKNKRPSMPLYRPGQRNFSRANPEPTSNLSIEGDLRNIINEEKSTPKIADQGMELRSQTKRNNDEQISTGGQYRINPRKRSNNKNNTQPRGNRAGKERSSTVTSSRKGKRRGAKDSSQTAQQEASTEYKEVALHISYQPNLDNKNTKKEKNKEERLPSLEYRRPKVTDKTLYDPNDDNPAPSATSRTNRPEESKNRRSTGSPPTRRLHHDAHMPLRPVRKPQGREEVIQQKIDEIKQLIICLQNIKGDIYYGRWDEHCHYRHGLMEASRNFQMTNIVKSRNNGIDKTVWSKGFAPTIHGLRKEIRVRRERKESDEEGSKLCHLLELQTELKDETNSYYKNLIEDLADRYNNKEVMHALKSNDPYKENLLQPVTTTEKKYSATAESLKTTAHLFMCFLGEMRRHSHDPKERSIACSWYKRAHMLRPDNCQPYAKLASLHQIEKRTRESIYHYLRSMNSGNSPAEESKEQLSLAFDESRKKLESLKRIKNESDESLIMPDKWMMHSREISSRPPVREVWIRPDYPNKYLTATSPSSSSKARGDQVTNEVKSKTEEQKENSSGYSEDEQLCMMFVQTLLNVLRVLFTRVNMETLDALQNDCIQLLEECLHKEIKQLDERILLEIIVMNTSLIVHEKRQKEKQMMEARDDDVVDDEQCNLAMKFHFRIFQIICKHLLRRLKGIRQRQESLGKPLLIQLEFVKLSCDWLYYNMDMWNNPYKLEPKTFSSLIQSLAELCDELLHFAKKSFFGVEVLSSPGGADLNELRKVHLYEDKFMMGFNPLTPPKNGEVEQAYVEIEDGVHQDRDLMDKIVAQTRIYHIFNFLQALCGMNQPLLKYTNGRHVPITPSVLSNHEEESGDKKSSLAMHDISEKFKSLNWLESCTPHVSDASEFASELACEDKDLIAQHQRLKEQSEKEAIRLSMIKQSLAAETDEPINEVRPRYLVLDTNCFIDQLDQIKKLLNHNFYTICVPVVVYKELLGLATSCKRGTDNPTHAMTVQENAEKAVQYLKYSFDNHCAGSNASAGRRAPFDQNQLLKLKVLTHRGSELTSLTFLNEDYDKHVKNDKKILMCCINYEKNNSRSSPTPPAQDSAGGNHQERKQRNTVLITEDRNLKIHALNERFPAKSMHDFMRWAEAR